MKWGIGCLEKSWSKLSSLPGEAVNVDITIIEKAAAATADVITANIAAVTADVITANIAAVTEDAVFTEAVAAVVAINDHQWAEATTTNGGDAAAANFLFVLTAQPEGLLKFHSYLRKVFQFAIVF